MTHLQNLLETTVQSGTVPGAAALVAHGEDVEIAAAGEVEPESIVRLASITKPITAAAVMILVDEGLVSLGDPIARWLPELASPRVVRTLQSAIDDVVAAARPITVEDVLASRAGWGFPSDFSLPAVVELFERVPVFGPRETPDEWLATLAQVPMLRQPGEAWLYNTCSDVQGVLVARVSGHPLPEFLAERIFEPLGMTDTGFRVPSEKLGPPIRSKTSRTNASVPDRRGTLDGAADLPVGRGRPRLDARRLAPFRAHAARRRRRAPIEPIGALDDNRPSHAEAARRVDVVPRGSGLGLRRCRLGRRPLRLGRRHRHERARRAIDRSHRRPSHAATDDRTDANAIHARVLAVRVRRLLAQRSRS